METIVIDGIEITISPPEKLSEERLEMKDYYVVTSPDLPEGVVVRFYRTLTEWIHYTRSPSGAWRHRRHKTIEAAREAAIKYAVNSVKKAQKIA